MSWEDKVRKVEPYVAGEQPKDKGVIKLNTNECPYPPAPGVMIAAQVLRDGYSDLRLYPDMDATMLVNALAEYYQVDPDQIFVGVGSDDVLALWLGRCPGPVLPDFFYQRESHSVPGYHLFLL